MMCICTKNIENMHETKKKNLEYNIPYKKDNTLKKQLLQLPPFIQQTLHLLLFAHPEAVNLEPLW